MGRSSYLASRADFPAAAALEAGTLPASSLSPSLPSQPSAPSLPSFPGTAVFMSVFALVPGLPQPSLFILQRVRVGISTPIML